MLSPLTVDLELLNVTSPRFKFSISLFPQPGHGLRLDLDDQCLEPGRDRGWLRRRGLVATERKQEGRAHDDSECGSFHPPILPKTTHQKTTSSRERLEAEGGHQPSTVSSPTSRSTRERSGVRSVIM